MKRKLTRVHNIDRHVGKGFEKLHKIVLTNKSMEGLSQNTLKGYGRVITALTSYFGDREDVFNITQQEARDFIRWLQTDKIHYRDKLRNDGIMRGLKPSTINTYLKVCKTFYQVLVDEGYIESNPFSNIKTMKRAQERIKTIPPEDIRKLLDNLNKAYYTEFRLFVAIHVLLDTFGRIDEVLSIKKKDIDFTNRTILFPETKNGCMRYVGFSSQTKRLIEELLDECRDFGSEYVFLGVDGDKFQPDAFRASLKHYCDLYDIKTHITPHMFRHTAAMLFLENGGNMRVLQKILGHKRLQTTEIYAHVTDDLKFAQQTDYSPLGQIISNTKPSTNRSRSRRVR